MAIGSNCLDLSALTHLFSNPRIATAFGQTTLNEFMSLGRQEWSEARTRIRELLSRDTPTLRDDKELLSKALIGLDQCRMHLPATIGDYTDFYSSRSHATNVGIMFRGDWVIRGKRNVRLVEIC